MIVINLKGFDYLETHSSGQILNTGLVGFKVTDNKVGEMVQVKAPALDIADLGSILETGKSLTLHQEWFLRNEKPQNSWVWCQDKLE